MGLRRRRAAAGIVPGCAEVVLRAVVAVDDERDLELVPAGCALARERNARLELLVGIARPAPTCWFGPSPAMLAQSLEELSAWLLEHALGDVCADVPVTYRQVSGNARKLALAQAREQVGCVVLVRGGCRAAPRLARRRPESVLLVPPSDVPPPVMPLPVRPEPAAGFPAPAV